MTLTVLRPYQGAFLSSGEDACRVDFSEWGFGFGALDPAIGKAVTDAIKSTLDEAPLILEFPSSLGFGGQNFAPLTIAIGAPFTSDEYKYCYWSFDLAAALLAEIKTYAVPGGGSTPRGGAKVFGGMADALRALASEIDKLIFTKN